MHLIKLDATDSTNAYLRKLLLSNVLDDYTVVTARQQKKGRGQMGTIWQSDAGKNLTFSVLRNHLNLLVDDSFVLNLCVSLAVYSVLKQHKVPELSIKWPNDILSGRSKLCGILIENSLSGNKINTSIIGIGLNVNQLYFEKLQNVSSLQLVLGKTFDLDTLLQDIVSQLKKVFLGFEQKGAAHLWDEYADVLFRKGKPSTFEDKDGERFMGFIKGVSKDGKLIIALEDAVLKTFDLKEVRLLY
ncbi:BirA family transcriptional regulator, biotin operon repressor / biotin-[acetyl-CoA-carboxylase] ligase [Pricia antarctica]|uniref:BirA family transcriptional regulator, biotin operon repressor / biotin-[acetyl-CoA-carboxylase] ligase n=1 Tax=Pricia antarctica TaxID=641691 RepID=A0A1G7GGT7_9FLAO|nr:biotin--[acetyl-CoA-carboxylase] ligase [Pricia antarctica]SDE87326.1 BirA family transcriptional regulator, biotin operon repressor / biotin-[acetyl-CoA-carboxylase] ligase [Pricia antarctica]